MKILHIAHITSNFATEEKAEPLERVEAMTYLIQK